MSLAEIGLVIRFPGSQAEADSFYCTVVIGAVTDFNHQIECFPFTNLLLGAANTKATSCLCGSMDIKDVTKFQMILL